MIMRYILGIILVPVLSVAGPVGLVRLDRLIDQANVIIVGRVIEGSQSGTSASIVLELERRLKGSARTTVYTALITTSNEFAITRNLKGLRGIWFLALEANGAYRVLPTMVGSVPLEFSMLPALSHLPASWAAEPSATATENVLRELAAALDSKEVADVGLSAEFLSQIPAEPGSTISTLYRRMLKASNPIVFSAGLAGLIRGGEAAALAILQSRTGQISGQRGASLSQAVCEYMNGNPIGLKSLSELATGPETIPRLRECAAYALRNIHTRESIPFLLILLDSNSRALRYEGVAGLASYANSGFIPAESRLTLDGVTQLRARSTMHTNETEENFPTLETFVKDEGRYIAFWKLLITKTFNAVQR